LSLRPSCKGRPTCGSSRLLSIIAFLGSKIWPPSRPSGFTNGPWSPRRPQSNACVRAQMFRSSQLPRLVHGHFVRKAYFLTRVRRCPSCRHSVEDLTDEAEGIDLVVVLASGEA